MVAIPFLSSIPEKYKEGRRPIGYVKRVPKKGDIYWAEVTDRWVKALCNYSCTKFYCIVWEGDKMTVDTYKCEHPDWTTVPEKFRQGRTPVGIVKKFPKKGDIHWGRSCGGGRDWYRTLSDVINNQLFCVLWEEEMLDLTKPLYWKESDADIKYFATELPSGYYYLERQNEDGSWVGSARVEREWIEKTYTNEPPVKKAVCKVKTVYYWNCPHCTKRVDIENDLRGTTVTCNWCSKSFQLVGDEDE